MFIPIGLDQTAVRRLPWVSIAVIALNLLVFLVVGTGTNAVVEEAGRRTREVVEYWTRHPYLKLPEELLPPGMSQAERDKLSVMVEAMRSAPGQDVPDAETREQQQTELDQLVQRLREGVEEHPFKKWGLVPSDPKPIAFVTSMFLHSGWLHLLGNMLFFYLTGPFLEDAYGRPLFAVLYLASGVAASLAHVVSFPQSDAPLVGASGAIAGCMGAFLVRFVRTRIRFLYFYFFGLIRTGTVDLPAWVVLPLWFLQQLFFAGLSGSSGVAYRAHVGGFLFGAVAALLVKQLGIEERYIAPSIEKQISVTQHPALDEGMALLARGDTEAARESFRTVLAADPRSSDAYLGMWQSHLADGKPGEGAESLGHAIEEEVRRGEHALALAHWRELVSAARQSGPAPMRWRLAASLADSDRGASLELLRDLAADAGAGLLAEKAARQLAALGEPVPSGAARDAAAPAADPPAERPRPVPQPETSAAPPQVAAPEPAPAEVHLAPAPPPPNFWEVAAEHAAPAAQSSGTPEVEPCAVEALQADGLLLRGFEGGSDLLPFTDVSKIVVAGIEAAPKPFLVLDLVLAATRWAPMRVERLLSTELDPRQLVGRPDLKGMDAFRELVRAIAAGSGAPVLPVPIHEAALPVPVFGTVEAYETEALFPACRPG